MNKEIIYNCGGVNFWIKKFEEGSGRFCLYAGKHGKYLGDFIENEIFNANTGEYIGEVRYERLMVNRIKIGKSKIKGNRHVLRFSQMGQLFVPKISKLELPEGYDDFSVGIGL